MTVCGFHLSVWPEGDQESPMADRYVSMAETVDQALEQAKAALPGRRIEKANPLAVHPALIAVRGLKAGDVQPV